MGAHSGRDPNDALKASPNGVGSQKYFSKKESMVSEYGSNISQLFERARPLDAPIRSIEELESLLESTRSKNVVSVGGFKTIQDLWEAYIGNSSDPVLFLLVSPEKGAMDSRDTLLALRPWRFSSAEELQQALISQRNIVSQEEVEGLWSYMTGQQSAGSVSVVYLPFHGVAGVLVTKVEVAITVVLKGNERERIDVEDNLVLVNLYESVSEISEDPERSSRPLVREVFRTPLLNVPIERAMVRPLPLPNSSADLDPYAHVEEGVDDEGISAEDQAAFESNRAWGRTVEYLLSELRESHFNTENMKALGIHEGCSARRSREVIELTSSPSPQTCNLPILTHTTRVVIEVSPSLPARSLGPFGTSIYCDTKPQRFEDSNLDEAEKDPTERFLGPRKHPSVLERSWDWLLESTYESLGSHAEENSSSKSSGWAPWYDMILQWQACKVSRDVSNSPCKVAHTYIVDAFTSSETPPPDMDSGVLNLVERAVEHAGGKKQLSCHGACVLAVAECMLGASELFRMMKWVDVELSCLAGGMSGAVVWMARGLKEIDRSLATPCVIKAGKKNSIMNEYEVHLHIVKETKLGKYAPQGIKASSFGSMALLSFEHASASGTVSAAIAKNFDVNTLESLIRSDAKENTAVFGYPWFIERGESSTLSGRAVLQILFGDILRKSTVHDVEAGTADKHFLDIKTVVRGIDRYVYGESSRGKRSTGAGTLMMLEKFVGLQTEFKAIRKGFVRILDQYFLAQNSRGAAAELAASLYPQGLVHGDLNGRNVLIDSKNDIMVIDFAHTGTRHIFADLCKMETCIVFEYVGLESRESGGRGVSEEMMKSFLLELYGPDLDGSTLMPSSTRASAGADVGIAPADTWMDSPRLREAMELVLILRTIAMDFAKESLRRLNKTCGGEAVDRTYPLLRVQFLSQVLPFILKTLSFIDLDATHIRFAGYASLISSQTLLEDLKSDSAVQSSGPMPTSLDSSMNVMPAHVVTEGVARMNRATCASARTMLDPVTGEGGCVIAQSVHLRARYSSYECDQNKPNPDPMDNETVAMDTLLLEPPHMPSSPALSRGSAPHSAKGAGPSKVRQFYHAFDMMPSVPGDGIYAITGDAGSGKSVFLRQIAISASQKDQQCMIDADVAVSGEQALFLPIYIDATQLSRLHVARVRELGEGRQWVHEGSVENTMGDLLGWDRASRVVLRHIIRRATEVYVRVILCLDGLERMSASRRQDVLSWVCDLRQKGAVTVFMSAPPEVVGEVIGAPFVDRQLSQLSSVVASGDIGTLGDVAEERTVPGGKVVDSAPRAERVSTTSMLDQSEGKVHDVFSPDLPIDHAFVVGPLSERERHAIVKTIIGTNSEREAFHKEVDKAALGGSRDVADNVLLCIMSCHAFSATGVVPLNTGDAYEMGVQLVLRRVARRADVEGLGDDLDESVNIMMGFLLALAYSMAVINRESRISLERMRTLSGGVFETRAHARMVLLRGEEESISPPEWKYVCKLIEEEKIPLVRTQGLGEARTFEFSQPSYLFYLADRAEQELVLTQASRADPHYFYNFALYYREYYSDLQDRIRENDGKLEGIVEFV